MDKTKVKAKFRYSYLRNTDKEKMLGSRSPIYTNDSFLDFAFRIELYC